MGAVSFACVTMKAINCANLRHLWFGIPPVSNVRSQQSGSMVVHLEVFNQPGEACLAPTQIYRTCRSWDAALAPVLFLCRASSVSS